VVVAELLLQFLEHLFREALPVARLSLLEAKNC
jgi:hypothetical protein